jgi:hypothetical protein
MTLAEIAKRNGRLTILCHWLEIRNCSIAAHRACHQDNCMNSGEPCPWTNESYGALMNFVANIESTIDHEEIPI